MSPANAPNLVRPLQKSFFWLLKSLRFHCYPSVPPSLTLRTAWELVGSLSRRIVKVHQRDCQARSHSVGQMNRLVLRAFGPLCVRRSIFLRRLIMFLVTLGWTSVGGLTDNRQWHDMTWEKDTVGFQHVDPVWEGCRQALIRAKQLNVFSSSCWMLISTSRRHYWLLFLLFPFIEHLPLPPPSVSCSVSSLCFLLVHYVFFRLRLRRW